MGSKNGRPGGGAARHDRRGHQVQMRTERGHSPKSQVAVVVNGGEVCREETARGVGVVAEGMPGRVWGVVIGGGGMAAEGGEVVEAVAKEEQVR